MLHRVRIISAEFLDRTSLWINRHGWLAFAVVSAAYWAIALRKAASEIFSFDELVTWHVARLPTLPAMYRALLAGVDQQLPMSHLLVRASLDLFGASHLASRLPAVFGFWVMLLSLYILLKRFVPVPFALAGAILPLFTMVWEYACQARSYGVILGAGAFALLCWHEAATGSRFRRPALAGLTLSLFLALSCHMMSSLMALPFAVGEAARSWERRRIDIPIWIAFALSTPAVLLYPAVFAAVRSFSLENLYPHPSAIVEFYSLLLRSAITPLLAAALAAYAVATVGPETRRPLLPRPLALALAGFALLPAIFVIVAFATRHFFFVPRYGVLAIVGIAPLLAAGAAYACRFSHRAGVAVLLVLAAWMAVTRLPAVRPGPDPAHQFATAYPLLNDALKSGFPVLASSPTAFLEADFYLPPQETSRLTYVVDFVNARRSSGEDIVQHLLLLDRQYLPLRASVMPVEEFLARRQTFLVHAVSTGASNWLFASLPTDRFRITLRARSDDESVLEVEPAR